MPEFAWPWLLPLLMLPPLFAATVWRRRRPALPVSDLTLFADLPRGRAGWLPRVRAGLWLTLLVLTALAATGPRWPDERTRLPTEGIALMFVVDVSGSMNEPVAWPGTVEPIPRIDAARRTLDLVIRGGSGSGGSTFPGRPNDLLGLVAFASWPDDLCPLTLSHNVLLRLLAAETVRADPAAGRTNIGDALELALLRLEAAGSRRKAIVLLSDGDHNEPLGDKPRQAAQLAHTLGVPVHTVDVGGPIPEDDAEAQAQRDQGRSTLAALAQLTGGRTFAAEDGAGMLAALADIDRLERREIRSFIHRRHVELTPWLALLAGLALLLTLGLNRSRWRELPG